MSDYSELPGDRKIRGIERLIKSAIKMLHENGVPYEVVSRRLHELQAEAIRELTDENQRRT